MFKLADSKLDSEAIEHLIANKVSKDELTHIIPSQESIDIRIKDFVQDATEDLQIKVDKKFKQVEDKFITLKKELDFDNINKLLQSKANKIEVNNNLSSHE